MSVTAVSVRQTDDAELRARVLQPGDPANLNLYVCPADEMYKRNDKRHYFAVGRSALANVRTALEEADAPAPQSILDLPCGHGRVLRFLHAAYPAARFTACDILRDGVNFCAATFGAEPVYSSEDVSRIALRRRFDLIWCGSLVTHLDAPRWIEFLRLFARVLKPGGVCVFTAHGQYVAECMRDRQWRYGIPDHDRLLADWTAKGFAYQSYAEQPGYGISLSTEAWIREQIARVPKLRWVAHHPCGWDNHQDVVVVQRRRSTWLNWLPFSR
jgi:SAM-dependent methyltransferase